MRADGKESLLGAVTEFENKARAAIADKEDTIGELYKQGYPSRVPHSC